MPIVFEVFRQVDSSLARRAQGSGLGLPVSRRLVELHGGRMWVDSEWGSGTTFYFTLPVVGDDRASSAPATSGKVSEGPNE
jgi:signal transduction histidine kinase